VLRDERLGRADLGLAVVVRAVDRGAEARGRALEQRRRRLAAAAEVDELEVVVLLLGELGQLVGVAVGRRAPELTGGAGLVARRVGVAEGDVVLLVLLVLALGGGRRGRGRERDQKGEYES